MKAICCNSGTEIILEPFCNPDLQAMRKSMRQKIIFDGRNQYEPEYVRTEGFEYFGVGRTLKKNEQVNRETSASILSQIKS